MCGTEKENGAISLRTCCAMSCTDKAHGTIVLRACYAMPGTELHRVCRRAVLRPSLKVRHHPPYRHMLSIRDVRYWCTMLRKYSY
eukprot:2646436-Rhodomonas_salina.3